MIVEPHLFLARVIWFGNQSSDSVVIAVEETLETIEIFVERVVTEGLTRPPSLSPLLKLSTFPGSRTVDP
jgi:hypothetical protein